MKSLRWLSLSLLLLGACSRGGYDPAAEQNMAGSTGGGSGGGGGGGSSEPLPQDTEFELRAEWDGPCEKAGTVDVNLGNAPEAFVRAANCQITGNEPDQVTIDDWSNQLRTVSYVRRVDVVRTLCGLAGRGCQLKYSDPWQQQVDLTTSCTRKSGRDLGAVLMYWSECPGGVNCGLDWANTHAPGMSLASPLLGFDGNPVGFYNPKSSGFWRRELLDARWAGLQFLALNTFGPDLAQLPRLVEALDDIGGGIQIALFDDTWGWGKAGTPWAELPNFNDSEAAAQLIFQKWSRFYTAVPTQYWYRYQGQPLIVFYNAGTLRPEAKSAATLARLRELFKAQFAEEPLLAIDRAFFQDPDMPKVADAQFRWNTFDGGGLSHSAMRGVSFDAFMAKWDAVGRDKQSEVASPSDRVIKGPELLEQYLAESETSAMALMATWNDLGEGTGLTRNYDYYYQGAWLAPNAFMARIRAAQCQ